MKRNLFCYSLILDITITACRSFILFFYKIEAICNRRINDTYSEKIIHRASKSDAKYDAVYKNIHRYLVEEAHFRDKDINLRKVAHECNVNRLLINEVLEARSCLTFPEYLRKKRIDYACNLLVKYPHYKIEAVSEASGFKTSRTFVRTFKILHRMPPSEYRKAERLKMNLFVDK